MRQHSEATELSAFMAFESACNSKKTSEVGIGNLAANPAWTVFGIRSANRDKTSEVKRGAIHN